MWQERQVSSVLSLHIWSLTPQMMTPLPNNIQQSSSHSINTWKAKTFTFILEKLNLYTMSHCLYSPSSLRVPENFKNQMYYYMLRTCTISN